MSPFVDTNVVVDAFDRADPTKQRIAIELFESADRLVISTQVLLETWWVLTRRLAEPLDGSRASQVIDELSELPVVATDPQLVRQAIRTGRRFEIAICDALVIEAARAAACPTVLSENFQAGQDFDGVKIETPFT